MPYTNDPQNDPADTVRFLVGDTNLLHQVLTDEEVAYLLAAEGGNTMRAAARAAEGLAALYSAEASEKRVGPLTIMHGTRTQSRMQAYLKLAAMLWARAGQSSVVPYAGGISVTDKLDRILDTDRVRPAFARRMMRFPNGVSESLTSGEILSPSQEVP